MDTGPIHSGSHLKKLFKNSSLYFLSSMLSKMSSLVLLPVLTKTLPLQQYGVLANLLSVISFMSIMVSLYMDSALGRFYFDNNSSDEKLKNLVSTVFWFEVLWGGFITAIFFFISRFYLSSKYGVRFFPTLFLVCCLPIFIQLGLLGKVYLKNNLKTSLVALPDVVFFAFTTLISIYFIS
jgi:O-antigen/teichoic acid export membrane protein